MWNAILNAVGLGKGDGKPKPKRSSKWPALRAAHLKIEAICQSCGGSEKLEVHHRIPVSWDARLELEPRNLITLCEKDSMNCHFWVGHLGNWKSYNPEVRPDAEVWRKKIFARPMKFTGDDDPRQGSA